MSFTPLPIDSIEDKFVSELEKAPGILLSAPTGTGKSTRIPLFSRKLKKGKIVVLQPRRLPAIALASRICEELEEPIGKSVGYQVRGKSAAGNQCGIIFQTYGWFYAWLKENPTLKDIEVLILDEFHERQVEMDLIWLWLRYLKQRKFNIPKIVMMSATLDVADFPEDLGRWPHLKLESPLFPIKLIYIPGKNFNRSSDRLVEAAKLWNAGNTGGSCLCFLPGWKEINQAKFLLEKTKDFESVEIECLHGSMDLKDQHRVCSPSAKKRIILSTNIAETSLTIPDVNAVIDSGWAREIFYQSDKKINSLKLERISLYNATQRMGRCGRTGPGTCYRLWDGDLEPGFKKNISSQILNVEWSSALLGLLELLCKLGEKTPLNKLKELEWLSTPDPQLLKASIDILTQSGAIDPEGNPSPRGLWMASLPIHPRLAQLLYLSHGGGKYNIHAAMCAIIEGGGKLIKQEGNLEKAADYFMSNPGRKDFSQEAELWNKLQMAGKNHPGLEKSETAQIHGLSPWLRLFKDRLSIKTDHSNRYRMVGNLAGEVSDNNPLDLPNALLALGYQENVQLDQKYGNITYWLGLSEQELREFTARFGNFKNEFRWIAKSGKISMEKVYYYQDLPLYSEKIAEKNWPKNELSQYMAKLMLENKLSNPLNNPEFQSLLAKYNLARESFPEYRIPALDTQDYELMYMEWAEGKSSERELEMQNLLKIFKDYIGRESWGFLEKEFPDKRLLPSGRMAKFFYPLNGPPEISARIADFYECEGKYFLAGGKIPVLYNILAPNFRSVQKTYDLSDFWKNTYPEVKKELRRRYPRHKWI